MTGCRGSAPTVALLQRPGRRRSRSAGRVDRDAMRFPPCRPARGRALAEGAEGTPRATHDVAEGSATRSGAHLHAVGGCAQHTRPRARLFDLALSGGARHERLLREAPGWRGACLRTRPGPLQPSKRRDSPAVCVTQRYVQAAAGRLTPGRTCQRAAQQGADRLVLLADRQDTRRSDSRSA
jgi:hypothetical protein